MLFQILLLVALATVLTVVWFRRRRKAPPSGEASGTVRLLVLCCDRWEASLAVFFAAWTVAAWCQLYTGIGGVTEILSSFIGWALHGSWLSVNPFSARSPVTTAASVAYWVSILVMLVVAVCVIAGSIFKARGYRALSTDAQAIIQSLGEVRDELVRMHNDVSASRTSCDELATEVKRLVIAIETDRAAAKTPRYVRREWRHR